METKVRYESFSQLNVKSLCKLSLKPQIGVNCITKDGHQILFLMNNSLSLIDFVVTHLPTLQANTRRHTNISKDEIPQRSIRPSGVRLFVVMRISLVQTMFAFNICGRPYNLQYKHHLASLKDGERRNRFLGQRFWPILAAVDVPRFITRTWENPATQIKTIHMFKIHNNKIRFAYSNINNWMFCGPEAIFSRSEWFSRTVRAEACRNFTCFW